MNRQAVSSNLALAVGLAAIGVLVEQWMAGRAPDDGHPRPLSVEVAKYRQQAPPSADDQPVVPLPAEPETSELDADRPEPDVTSHFRTPVPLAKEDPQSTPDERFEAEHHNRAWAAAKESELILLLSESSQLAEAPDVECRTSVCRIRVSEPLSVDDLMRLGGGGSIRTSNNGDGSLRTEVTMVFY